MFMTRTALIAAGAFSLAGCGLTGPAHTEPPPPQVDATVTMGLVNFNPEAVAIQSGQTVQWRNTSPIAHTVTADKSMAASAENVQLPPGAESFHSGSIGAGEVWSYTFTVPGTYRYVCLPHEKKGMIGTVIVRQGPVSPFWRS